MTLADPAWKVLGTTIRGEAHRRKGVPNQDAFAWTPPGDELEPVVVAVADGHGSRRTPRSDIGARLAVSVATRAVREHLRQSERPGAGISDRIARELPQLIVQGWMERVREDLRSNPLSDEETRAMGEGQASQSEGPEFSYGATLLVAAIAGHHAVYVQIGDGDIITVSHDGNVSKPIPPDPRLIANETTSLCRANAERDFRVAIQALDDSDPELILLATDGYSNAFVDEPAFLRVGSDILRLLHEHGPGWVNDQIQEWLTKASRDGSGDDITLGVLWRASNRSSAAQESNSTVVVPTTNTTTDVAQSTRQVPDVIVPVAPSNTKWAFLAALVGILGIAAGLLIGSRFLGKTEANRTVTPRNSAAGSEALSDQEATWIWTWNDTLLRVDAGGSSSFAVKDLAGREVRDVVAAGGSLWVATAEGMVYELDEESPTAGIVGKPIDVGVPLAKIEFSADRLWMIPEDGQRIYYAQLETSRSLQTISLPRSRLPSENEEQSPQASPSS